MRMPVLVPCAIAVIPFDAEFAQEGPGAATELFNREPDAALKRYAEAVRVANIPMQ